MKDTLTAEELADGLERAGFISRYTPEMRAEARRIGFERALRMCAVKGEPSAASGGHRKERP